MKNKEKPYILVERVVVERHYNKNFGDDRVCGCGHAYYRHFDTYEKMDACGCKYCDCRTWHEGQNEDDIERERHQAGCEKEWADEEKLKK